MTQVLSTLKPVFSAKSLVTNMGPVGFVFWRYEKMLEDTKIPSGGHRDEVFDLPKGANFPVTAEVKLMFRTYPQAVTNLIREQYPDLTNPAAILMTEQTVQLKPAIRR